MTEAPGIIHHEWSGTGSSGNVVLIHGSLDRSAGMARLARVLNPLCRVLRYDRRGYGRSWPHPGPFGVQGQVADLERLLDGKPAVLVGHSYGGNVALSASVSLPAGQVTGVAVYETPLSWMPWWPGDTAGGRSMQAPPEDAAEAFMKRLIGERAWEGLPARTRSERRREGVALQGELTWLRMNEPWRAEDVKVPLACGRGTDGLSHHRNAMQWLSENARGDLVDIEGAGHGAHNSHAAEFAARLVVPLLSR